MTPLEHDSAQSMGVRRDRGSDGRSWRVVRTCPCHRGEAISICFDTEEEANRCMAALHEDAHRSQVLREAA